MARARRRAQLVELSEQAERVARARQLLTHALECTTAHPIAECGVLADTLDQLIDS